MPELSFREELIVISSIFMFFALSIPIVIITSNDEVGHTKINQQSFQMDFSKMSYRDRIIANSVKIIESYNSKHNNKSEQLSVRTLFEQNPYKYNIPQPKALATMTRDEMRNLWKRFNFRNGTTLTSRNITIPLKVDWRDRGVVSLVKSQKNCGACWAYSTLGVIESIKAIKSGYLNELSSSQMLECNDDEMNCEGGDTVRLLAWLLENQIKIQLETDYLASVADDKCLTDKPGVRVKDFSLNNFSGNEHLMLLYLAHQGPLITCVNSINWLDYMNGIIQQNCSDKFKYLNHAVEIIGYDMTGEIPFYIAKNSWGRNYGINGYLKIAIGNNLCGIADRVSAVVVE